MKATDWTKIYKNKKYRGLWIALTSPNENKVIAFGKTLKETLKQAQKKGVTQPLVTQIPQEILPIVGII